MIVDIFRTLVAKSNDFVQIKPRYRYYISDTHKVCYACHSFIHVHLLSILYTYVIFIRNTWKVLKCGAGEGWRRSVGPIM